MPMTRNRRPRLEPLEGRMMLSGVTAPHPIPIPDPRQTLLPQSLPSPIQIVPPGGIYLASNPTGRVNQPTIVGQQAGSVTLILGRRSASPTGSLNDTLQVQVATTPTTPGNSTLPAAVADVQYRTISETITFPPGVTEVPVTIPIVANASNPGQVTFLVVAAEAGVTPLSYGSTTAAQTVVIAANPNAVGPRLVSAHMVTSGHRASDFVLKFDRPMDPASVQDLAA